MIDAENADFELNEAQKRAVKELEKAFANCLKANVYFHNCYGTLIAYDGWIVRDVNDTKSDIPCRAGVSVKIYTKLDSWADDKHYVHFKKQEAKKNDRICKHGIICKVA